MSSLSATASSNNIPNCKKMASPLHLQRLETALDMRPFMNDTNKILSQPLTSSESEDSDTDRAALNYGDKIINGMKSSKQDRRNDKMHIYNFSQVGPQRKWLMDLLLSDTDSESEVDDDEYIKRMLKDYVREKKLRESYYKVSNNSQYGYFGSGMLSKIDRFPEHQRSVVGVKKRRKEREKKALTDVQPKAEKVPKKRGPKPKQHKEPGEIDPADLADFEYDELLMNVKDEPDDELDSKSLSNGVPGKRQRMRKSFLKTPEVMAARRRKVWQLMAKKEVGKIQRARTNNHKEMLQSCKRVSSMCMKVIRQRAMQSQKNMKETVWRAKRLTREMQGYWKRYDRVERETKRRIEKEAEEQRKLDVEIIEAKRQTRKLNFLITQTELYAHFMSKKLGHGTEEEQLRILNQLEDEVSPRLAAIDDYNSDLMKQKAQQNASDAFNTERSRTQEFDFVAQPTLVAPNIGADGMPEYPQPEMFKGSLKGYQLKGMTWLANLYDQGISGILADEMGLGKTVQSIAFLCHIAERFGVWGPFLIISPASTLHNWQQEMQRFAPEFNVVPYWGSPNERKILRQFWEQKDLHTKDASFHVVITSYQLVVSDYKYFNRIKWQYMVLDEAQAIKSSSSVRWKLLLGFNCRNRLLLSGTPIQNSMAELWALLHFIMPTLFDSHDEFNEWFSKDIESHAENKTGIDERQISRLHMILKPFMLRRIKKDVENELSDKIEIMVYCPLTTRQKLLYMALKKKIRIEDLLHFTVGGGDGHIVDKNFTSNLMNLVMQFRKVCNHPDLFERRDAKSPFAMKLQEYSLPRLIFNEGILLTSLPSKRHILYNRFSIFKSENVQRSLFPLTDDDKKIEYPAYVDLEMNSTFSFARFIALSPTEIENLSLSGYIYFIKYYSALRERLKLLNYRGKWWKNTSDYNEKSFMLLEPTIENNLNVEFTEFDSIIRKLIFTAAIAAESSIYTFGDYKLHNMQESIEHRVIRSKHSREINPIVEIKEEVSTIEEHRHVETKKHEHYAPLLSEFPHYERPPVEHKCEPFDMPRFLYGLGGKVQANGRKQYCDSRAAQWSLIRHEQCENAEGREILKGGFEKCRPLTGWSNILIPDKQSLIYDSGKLAVLDNLLTRLKSQGHRVLIYSQMTKMIDLLEEYMWHRRHRYMRLDGSSKISARRDMVADFQNRADIFVFLLSTRAGGLGINLTAADTVIFYDSDWNPTVDQQAMDRAHRLGQTKQVTVYRLICKGTIEERILQRAREKSEIQRMVISGGNFKPDHLKTKEVVSLLLDDEEIELKYRQKTEERKMFEEPYTKNDKDNRERKRKGKHSANDSDGGILTTKKIKLELGPSGERIDVFGNEDETDAVGGSSYDPSEFMQIKIEREGLDSTPFFGYDDSSNEALVVDCDSPNATVTPAPFSSYGASSTRRRHHPRGTKRGRPRGSRRGGGTGSLGRSDTGGVTTVAASMVTSSSSGETPTQSSGEFQSSSATVVAPPPVKRGPGRPRLKPGGPVNQGYRGTPRTRKPIGPLVVPLGQSPAATPLNRSPAMSRASSPALTSSDRLSANFYQSNDDE